jgi:hypothetical protein
LPSLVPDWCEGYLSQYLYKANSDQQHPKAHLWPLIRLDQITNKVITERAATQELYKIAKALIDEMTLTSSLEISDFSNTIAKIGAFVLKKTTKVNIKEARRKLMPLHTERMIEPAFNTFAFSL